MLVWLFHLEGLFQYLNPNEQITNSLIIWKETGVKKKQRYESDMEDIKSTIIFQYTTFLQWFMALSEKNWSFQNIMNTQRWGLLKAWSMSTRGDNGCVPNMNI